MSGGAASGVNLDYQKLAKTIVDAMSPDYEPLDMGARGLPGIDVPIPATGTTWHVDVALRSKDRKKLLLVECKRHIDAVAQSYAGAFAWIVAALRSEGEAKGVAVEAWLFVKSGAQDGAHRVADYAGIRVVQADEGQTPESLAASFITQRADGTKSVSHYIILSDSVSMTDSLTSP